jgi:hypothetical protein
MSLTPSPVANGAYSSTCAFSTYLKPTFLLLRLFT